MKSIFRVIIIVAGLCAQSTAWAVFDFPHYLRWKSEMNQHMEAVFTNLVPEKERSRWTKDEKQSYLGDINEDACTAWIPSDNLDGKWSECLSAVWACNPIKRKSQFESIEALFEMIKKNAGQSSKPIQWTFTPLSNTEALIERNEANGEERAIQRIIMIGNWVVSLQFEQRAISSAIKGPSWEENKALWIQRFSDLQFN